MGAKLRQRGRCFLLSVSVCPLAALSAAPVAATAPVPACRKESLRWWCSRSQDSVKAQTYNEQCYDIFPPALLGVFLPSFLSALHRVMFTDVRLFRRLFCYLLPLANKMEK